MTTRYKTFKTPLSCPRLYDYGFGKRSVSVGDIVGWQVDYTEEDGKGGAGFMGIFYGKVLGVALCDGDGKAYPTSPKQLLVLMIGERMNHGFFRHVSVEDVHLIVQPSDFIRWFFFGELPPVDELEKLVNYGVIRDDYIGTLLDGDGLRIVRRPWPEGEMEEP